MHIPDGFLAPPVFLTLDAAALPAIAWVARRAQRDPGILQGAADAPEAALRIPLLGVMGAFVFAAQMVNVPLGFGISGHLLGGTLLALVLGPASASLVLTAVLVLQALLFQDGGVLALGANIFNMALAGVIFGYLPCWLWGRRTLPIFLGATLSVLASGVLALWELSLSGVAPARAVMLVALAVFLLAGVLEGVITIATLRAITRLSPQALPEPAPVASLRARVWIAAAALLLATMGVAFSSAAPDSVMHLADQMKLALQPAWTHAPMANYELSGLGLEWLRRPAAGMCGVLCVYVLFALSGKKR